jgi:hypothetical protein
MKALERGSAGIIVRDVTRPDVEKPPDISAGSHRDRRLEEC